MMNYWYGIDLHWAYSDLLRQIYRKTICQQSALDVLHNALVRFALAKNPDRFQEPHAFLQVIVRNQLVDEYRYHRRLVSLDISEDEAEQPESSQDSTFYSPSAEHLADINQRLASLQALIESLPARCREVFWLYRVEGLKQAEIAGKLNISIKMVEKHVARGYVALLEAHDLIQ
jgi:RNA polymerase sigma factor (sigma-70 family)